MTNYADDLKNNLLIEDAMTDDLWDVFNGDLEKIKKLNISSDRERNLLFYVENFIDDLLSEYKIKDYNKDELIEKMFEILRKKTKVDLTDFRIALYHMLNKREKLAYVNMSFEGEHMLPKRNVDSWIKTLDGIYKLINNGLSRIVAENKLMEGWDPMEKHDFKIWANYYEGKNHEKYAKVKNAYDIPNFDDYVPQKNNSEDGLSEENPIQDQEIDYLNSKVKQRKTPEETKKALVSRLDAASKLLRDFSNIWPVQIWDRLSQSLSDLKREIITLKTASSVSDRIIRTANIWEREGFSEGSFLLKKIAAGEDTVSEIQQALTGKKDNKRQEEVLSVEEEPAPSVDESEIPMMDEGTPPMLGQEGMTDINPEDMGVPMEGVADSLPDVPEIPEVPQPEIEQVSVENTNPFFGTSVKIQDVLDVLEPLLQKLSEREFARALSKADMLLDAMNIASHFPEMSEIQSKALEMTIYINTRVEKIIGKLKGGLSKEDVSKNTSEEIDMSELTEMPQAMEPQAPIPQQPIPFNQTGEK